MWAIDNYFIQCSSSIEFEQQRFQKSNASAFQSFYSINYRILQSASSYLQNYGLDYIYLVHHATSPAHAYYAVHVPTVACWYFGYSDTSRPELSKAVATQRIVLYIPNAEHSAIVHGVNEWRLPRWPFRNRPTTLQQTANSYLFRNHRDHDVTRYLYCITNFETITSWQFLVRIIWNSNSKYTSTYIGWFGVPCVVRESEP
jgi:hypothetical protein